MMFALGAAGSVLDTLQSLSLLKPPSRAKAPDPSQAALNPFDPRSSTQAQSSTPTSISGQCCGRSSISPQTMSALIDAQAQISSTSSSPTKPSDSLKDLVSQIDADGSGAIDKGEFEDALGAGGTNLKAADSVFGKLDANHDGSVSVEELASALSARGHHGHHHQTQAASSSSLANPRAALASSDDGVDSSDTNSTDKNSPDSNSTNTNSSTNPLHHLPLTLVQLPLANMVMVPIDPLHVNFATGDLNQLSAFRSVSISA